ncbi:hypothetical protein PsalN5692_02475 [Piscirickettsia salmonis]|nr:hypothetical protein PsalN5692_02475 [Piscirickettsia salmonis]
MRLQTYADQGYLCAERIESLSEHQKKVLGLNIIYQLIQDGSLTI